MNGLWHWDCHHGSRKVLTARGEWRTPILFGVLDDRSRLACHLQWYLAETAEIIAHGLSQAFQKRGLPRSGLSDNGAAMTAAEITEGLSRLGVLHQTTLPYSPYQAKSKGAAVDTLAVTDLSAEVVRAFLAHLESERQCSTATRNQRLGSIHALARFIGAHSPQHVEWCAQNSDGADQKGCCCQRHLPGEAGDRCAACRSQSIVKTREHAITPCCCSFTTLVRV